LAADIENKFGVVPKLIGGHNAIFDVAVNGSVVYTNNKQCGQFPTHEQIFEEVRKYKDPVSEEHQAENVHKKVSIAPCCPSPSDGGSNGCDPSSSDNCCD
jgi:predicted Rdx family selenoprotein